MLKNILNPSFVVDFWPASEIPAKFSLGLQGLDLTCRSPRGSTETRLRYLGCSIAVVFVVVVLKSSPTSSILLICILHGKRLESSAFIYQDMLAQDH